MDEIGFDDFDSVTWNYMEDLIDSGEYGDFDGEGDEVLDFDMTKNPFAGTDDWDGDEAYQSLRRFLTEAGAEPDQTVTIHIND